MERVRIIIYPIRQWPMIQNVIEFQAPLEFGKRAKIMKILADGKILLIFGPGDNAHWAGADDNQEADFMGPDPQWAQEIVGNSNTTFMVVCPRRFQVLRIHKCVLLKYVPCFALTENKKGVIIVGGPEVRIVNLDTGGFSVSFVRPWDARHHAHVTCIMPVLDDELLFIATTTTSYWYNMEDDIDVISLWDEELISTLEYKRSLCGASQTLFKSNCGAHVLLASSGEPYLKSISVDSLEWEKPQA